MDPLGLATHDVPPGDHHRAAELGNGFLQRSCGRPRVLLEDRPPIKAKAYLELARDVAAALNEMADEPLDIEAVAHMIVAHAFQLRRVMLTTEPSDAKKKIENR